MATLTGPYTRHRARRPTTLKGDMSDADDTLTAKQAGELLRVHYRLVVRMADAGTLPGRKVGRSWRFSEAALREWLRAKEPPKR